jgi:anti-sigma28 factor (negative regulator of flagellin synthesis)
MRIANAYIRHQELGASKVGRDADVAAKTSAGSEVPGAEYGDGVRVSVSDRAKELGERAKLSEAKVDRLRAALESNKLEVNLSTIASKLLRSEEP